MAEIRKLSVENLDIQFRPVWRPPPLKLWPDKEELSA